MKYCLKMIFCSKSKNNFYKYNPMAYVFLVVCSLIEFWPCGVLVFNGAVNEKILLTTHYEWRQCHFTGGESPNNL